MFSKLITLKNKKKGFTLIELIVVIAILGILAAILVPSMMTFIGNARQATVKADCRTLVTAGAAYAAQQIQANLPIVSPLVSTSVPNAALLQPYMGSPTGVWSVTIDPSGSITDATYTEGGKTSTYTDGAYS